MVTLAGTAFGRNCRLKIGSVFVIVMNSGVPDW
jgi:hypothetical protein